MPANLPPAYKEAERAFRRSKTVPEKMEALQQMLAIMPKHKGTDHLRADLRARMAKLEDEASRRPVGARAVVGYVRKEGAGQVALIGPPNAGKSRLLAALTDAKPKIGEYPFTTQLPQPAMMPYEDVHVQLVDLPPVIAHGMPAWLRPLLKQADVLSLVVDLSADPLAQMAALLWELHQMGIVPVAASFADPGPEAGRQGAGTGSDYVVLSTQHAARASPPTPDGRHQARDGVPTPDEVPPATPKRVLVAANKLDAPDANVAWELLLLEYGERLPLCAISTATGAGLNVLREAIFRALDVVRVYTRAREQKVEEARRADPIVLRRGSIVEDVAMNIHKDLAQRLRFAEIWGSGKFAGQRVGRDFAVQDGDVVELYT